MPRAWRVMVGLAVIGNLVMVTPPDARAQAQGPPEGFSYATGAVTKFGRGFTNMMTGWMEVGVQTWRGAQEQGAAGAALGFGRGMAMIVLRTLAGVYEVATFLIPLPENWEPPLKPGFGLPGYEQAGTPGP